MKKIECFKTRLIELDSFHPESFDLTLCSIVHSILCDGLTMKANPTMMIADPFLFVHEDTLYLFFEHKRIGTPGVLKMISTTDLRSWSEPVVVLEEPFHLSYPFVFEDGGNVYMIPETSAAGEVRLYKADDNSLRHFAQEQVLINHTDGKKDNIIDDYCDSSVFRHVDGKYYLMTTMNITGVNNLYLYYSDSLNGPYIEHPMSPICSSQKYGRNAGSLFVYEGKLYRVAQDCVERYGDNIHLFEIVSLTATIYEERLIKENILDTEIDFYKEGGHQFNIVRYKDKLLATTDAKEYHLFLHNRIMVKLGRILGMI